MILGPVQFDAPASLILLPLCWAALIWIARRSLTGMGTRLRRLALAVRLLVVSLLIAALAEPNWRLTSESVAVVVVADASKSMPPGSQDVLKEYLGKVAQSATPEDRIGFVTAAQQARAHLLPSRGKLAAESVEEVFAAPVDPGPADGTELGGAVLLAESIIPEDAAGRILLFSDGQETTGSLLAQAESARAKGIPIDVLPVPFSIDREVVFDELLAPSTARKGQTAALRFVLTATAPVKGRLSLLVDGQAWDLTPEAEGVSQEIELETGRNILSVPILMTRGGPAQFEAVFEPLNPEDDARPQNNSALAVTFVGSEGQVLVYTENPSTITELLRAMDESRLDVVIRSPSVEGHESLVELQKFDAVVLCDVPAHAFSHRQQEELAAFVHDGGGGLVMVGGPDSFGAGGWIGTPVAEVLPLKLDPPVKRQIPRGALALIMHSCEAPNGNYWGQQTALAAIGALSRLDLVGIVEDRGMGSINWALPLNLKGDGSAAVTAVNNLAFGDMPDFDRAMQLVLTALQGAKAGQKHCIIISDADPSGPTPSLVQQFVQAGVSISTVAIFPHTGYSDLQKMQNIAAATGGRYYLVNQQNQLGLLPRIFIKEAQVVRRTLIWEGEPVVPVIVNGAAQPMLGIPSLPAITGYVVTAEREGLALVTAKAPNDDPLVAQWQHGLGRAVAFTSDAASRWSAAWLSWPAFRSFWEQHIRWAMRPAGSANVSVVTRTQGDKTQVIVSALDSQGDALNFARFSARVTRPDFTGDRLELVQTGPGRYEGWFDSAAAGSYLVTMRYDAPGPADDVIESGTVQAAVTRPFADEYRALKDNTPLLVQVAESTGGRVLEWNPDTDDVFSRAGLLMPVALRPIWLAVALAGLAGFLLDVAIRRVRIDIPAIIRAVAGLFHRGRQESAGRIDALRAAREKARDRIADRSEAPPSTSAGAKFEASPEQLKAAPDIPLAGGTAPVEDKRTAPGTDRPPASDEEGGMSRLLAAKKRARKDMESEGDSRNE